MSKTAPAAKAKDKEEAKDSGERTVVDVEEHFHVTLDQLGSYYRQARRTLDGFVRMGPGDMYLSRGGGISLGGKTSPSRGVGGSCGWRKEQRGGICSLPRTRSALHARHGPNRRRA